MFSRIFDSAKRILSRSPSAQRASTEPTDLTTKSRQIDVDVDADMVTTRRGTETPGTDATPRGSVRKGRGKRELDTESTPTTAKRQRKSAGKKKAAPTEVSEPDQNVEVEHPDTVEVAIPPNQNSANEIDLPTRRRGSPKVLVGHESSPTAEQEPAFHTPAEQVAGSVYATPATHQPLEGSPTPKAIALRSRTPESNIKSGKRGKKVQQEEPHPRDEIPSSTQETNLSSLFPQDEAEVTEATSSQAQKAHVRFGSEEPMQTHAPEAPQQEAVAEEEDQEEDDDASDSDEAPEILTTASAKSKVKAAEAEAAHAYQAQQERETLKREEREKKKADEQAEKRRKEENKAKKLARRLAKDGQAEAENSLDVDIHNLPALLPDSLLEAAGDRRPPTPPHVRPGKSTEELRKEKLSRHIKFLDRSSKPTKDIKKGSLNVSVLAQQNKLLPPKVNKDTKNIREHWLKGRQVEKKSRNAKQRMKFQKFERRSTGGGFLRNED